MGNRDFDPLKFARRQLQQAADEAAQSRMSLEMRIQLGLLASQIALADLLSGEPQDEESADGGVDDGEQSLPLSEPKHIKSGCILVAGRLFVGVRNGD